MAKWLVERLARPEILVAPGAYDALTAKLVAQSGAEAVYCGGFASIASAYALPDVGLLALGETGEIYRRVAATTELPVVVDADTGYGGPLNVRRTVRELARAGVAAVHVEDQLDPKRCGHVEGKRVLAPADAETRVRAAVDAAGADGPAVIARTDALAPEGMASVLERAARFADAGADALFVDAPRTVEQLAEIRAATELPVVFNAASTGVGPVLSRDRLVDLGVDMVIYPIELLLYALDACRTALAEISAGREVRPPATFADVTDLLGLADYVALDQRWGG